MDWGWWWYPLTKVFKNCPVIDVEVLPLAFKVLRGRHEGGALVNNPFANGQVPVDIGTNIIALDLVSGNTMM